MREGDILVGIGDRNVKWETHDQVVEKIREGARHLKITVVTPIKAWVVNRRSESGCNTATASPCSVVRVFSPPSSRTSFSSSSSGSSETSDNSETSSSSTDQDKRKRSWAVLKINQ